ncbi:MAG: RNA-binding protein [Kiritimatiellaeota bacterium]|nr:RNA-binding protein [Kiritimatiellota bacterium]
MFSFLKKLFGGPAPKRPPGGKSDGKCVEIYVGNLSYDMKDRQLREAFAKYGAVKEARVVENRHNKRSKGFGFVIMPNRPEAEAAIKALHDRDVMGRRLRVNEAKNKSRE